MFPIHASAPAGLSHMNPVGGAVASAAKALRVHQSFQQQRTIPIAGLPFVQHLTGAQREDLAGQRFDAHPLADLEDAGTRCLDWME